MAEKIPIASLDINTEALITKTKDTKKSIDDLRESQKKLTDDGKKSSEQFVKNEVILKKLTAEYGQQKKVLTSLTDENNRFIKTEEALNNSVNKEIKTIEGARANNKELLAIRNKLNLSTDKGRKELDKINVKLDENNKFIKENVSAYEQQKIGIGDYEGAIRKVFPAGGQLIDTLKQTKAGLIAQKTALQGSTMGMSGLSKASKILKIALISTGIGAIVVALGTLITAFTSTQQGADKISKALAPIKGAFQGIIGVIQDISLNVFSQLGDRFTIVSGKILNGIDLIRIGWNKLSGDTEEVDMLQARLVERTKEIAEAQTSLNEKTNKLGEIWDGAGKRISEASEAQSKIVDLQIAIEKAEIRLTKQRAISLRIIKEQNKIAEDVTKTQQEREASAQKAIAESEKLLGAEQRIIDLKIQQTKIQQTQNDTDRAGELELAQLEAQREEKKTQALEMQTTLQNKLNIIKNQQATKEKTDADAEVVAREEELNRIRDFENRKLELENELALKRAETEEERNLLKAEQDFEKQQKELENLQLTEEEKLALEVLLLENSEQVKAEIRQRFLDEQVASIEAANKQIVDSEKKNAQIRQQVAQLLQGALTGLLGDSLAAKIGAIAIEAGIQAGLIKINAASASARVATNTASAISSAVAASPLTGGMPFSGINAAAGIKQQALIAASSAQGISRVLGAAALKSVGTLATAKLQKGGIIGGNRHSSGGTKFVGEDGTAFEAERGEYIGVMSRQATSKFMEFNNTYTPSRALTSSMSIMPKFQSGGIISPISSSVTSATDSTQNIAKVLANEINKVKIVTVVDDVTNMQGIQSEVINGATI